MVELVEQAELAIDEVIEVMGRATIEAVLEMSAEGVAGPKQASRAREEGEAVWYGGRAVRSTCRSGRFASSGRGSGDGTRGREASSRYRRTWQCGGRGRWRTECSTS